MGLSTNLWGRAPIYGAEPLLTTNLWGRAPHLWGWTGAGTPLVGLRWGRDPICGAGMMRSSHLWGSGGAGIPSVGLRCGRAPIYWAELILRTNLWGRALIYGAEHQPMGQSPNLWG